MQEVMENTTILHHHNEGQPPESPRSPGEVDKLKKVDDISKSPQAPVDEFAGASLEDKKGV